MTHPLMEQTWRWFGPADTITLPQIRQTGASGIVTALHDIAYRVTWPRAAVAERKCIHPDDPPRPLFGLPRIVSIEADIALILAAVASPANGLTLCTGSLRAHPANDLPRIASRFAPRTGSVHLRSVRKEPDGSFEEADHLGGGTDMVAVMQALLAEQASRRARDPETPPLPFRPDHGHALLDDATRHTHPGYPLIGRMRGLAELRGVMTALCHVHGWPA